MKHKKISISVWWLGIIALLGLVLMSCGDRKIATGVFVDSEVEGLTYSTDTISGTTDSSGAFQYRAGEIVTFYLNDLLLGSVEGQAVLTPVDLVEGAVDVTNDKVTNIARLLQTLDQNANLEDGIQLIDLALNTPNSNIDLSAPQLAFDSDQALQDYLSVVKPDDPVLLSIVLAQEHLSASISALTPIALSVEASVSDNSVSSGTRVVLTAEVQGTSLSSRWEQDALDSVSVTLSTSENPASELDDDLDATEAAFIAPDVVEDTELNFTVTVEAEDASEEFDTIRVRVSP